MKTDSFIFYRSFYEAIKGIPDNDRLNIYDSICEYALNHKDCAETVIAKGMMQLITPQIDANFRRRKNGSNGGRPATAKSGEEPEDRAEMDGEKNLNVTETKPNHNLNVTETKPKLNLTITKGKPNDNVNANVNVNANGNVRKKSFIPPTIQEVKAYCQERNNGVDPQRFYDYYSAAGWKDRNGDPVKNWKQKMIANWENKVEKEDKKSIYDDSNNICVSTDEEAELLRYLGKA